MLCNKHIEHLAWFVMSINCSIILPYVTVGVVVGKKSYIFHERFFTGGARDNEAARASLRRRAVPT